MCASVYAAAGKSSRGTAGLGQPRPDHAQSTRDRSPRLTPLASALAMLMMAGAVQAAPGAFSSGWFAAKNAASSQVRSNGAPSANLPGAVTTAAQARQRSQQSVNNLNRAVSAIAAAQAAQAAARQAALNAASSIPDGLTAGGLQVDDNPVTQEWTNANAPTQASAGGRTTVTVQQTSSKAILSWKTFNVGKNTTLHFDQTGGTQSDGSNDWIALNRINDPSQKPSQILGQIQAEGTVYLLNRNGIIFGAGSQVNTHALLASSMNLFSNDRTLSDKFFMASGIAATSDSENILGQGTGQSPFLTGGVTVDSTNHYTFSGDISVAAGATITTQPQGFTLLAAPNVSNAGTILADGGSAVLAADIALGYVGSDKGLLVADKSQVRTGTPFDGWGAVNNSGLVQARQGQVQLLGDKVNQEGVMLASTSLSHPGTIEIDALNFGPGPATLTFGGNSVTAVLPEKDGETTSSSPAADQSFQTSSVKLTGNTIALDSGALIEAPSGNVSMTAPGTNFTEAILGRIYIDQGATIDVSGLADVELPMSALVVTIPRIGQNELADSPLLRNGFLFTQKNVAIDSTVSGTRADGLDWIGSPILNAAGYVQNVPRGIDQLMTRGGSIAMDAGEVIARTGSQLRLDGGYLNYLPGMITTPNLLGANGLIYNIANADPDIAYVGFAGQYTASHPRWGVSETFTSPLLAGFSRWDAGFIVGGDAGTLSIGSDTTQGHAVLDGDLSAQAYAGRNQVSQGKAPNAGTLAVVTDGNYRLMNTVAPLEATAPGFAVDTPLNGNPALSDQPTLVPGSTDRYLDWYALPTDKLQDGGFGTLQVTSTLGAIVMGDGNQLVLQPGGSVALTAARVEVDGTLQTHGGSISLAVTGPRAAGGLLIGANALLDASGSWVNDSGRPQDGLTGDQYIDGGNISLVTYEGGAFGQSDGTGDITLTAGSVLDVSGGGYVRPDGIVAMRNGLPVGSGGSITLATHVPVPGSGGISSAPDTLDGGVIQMNGTLRAYGFSGGGTLTLEASQIQVGGTPAPVPEISLLYLPADFFSGQGFANYKLTAETDASIGAGATVNVTQANFLPNLPALKAAPTGSSLYGGDLATIGYLDPYLRWTSTQGIRTGLSMSAGGYRSWGLVTGHLGNYQGVDGSLTVGAGAALGVDPGGAVSLHAYDRVTILGAVTAPGGSIDLQSHSTGADYFTAPDRAIWLGSQARLDASGVSLVDEQAAFVRGESGSFMPRTGTVLPGGTVSITADQFLVAQAGSVIDVSGASDIYDLPQRQNRFGAISAGPASAPVWSDAGAVTLAAGAALLFDGTLSAHAGAPQGNGGSLAIMAVDGGVNVATPTALVLQQSGTFVPAGLQAGDAIPNGTMSGVLRFAADRLDGSGIQDLTIGVPADRDQPNGLEATPLAIPLLFAGDVDLRLAHAVAINAPAYAAIPADASSLPVPGVPVDGAGTVSITAPYVSLEGNTSAAVAVNGSGTLSVHADFLDLGGQLDLQGFRRASFESTGDIRFYAPPVLAYNQGTPTTGWLYTTADLDFTATRLYPVSDYSFLIDADPRANGNSAISTVAFHGNGKTDTATPLSAGGLLAVAATRIEQGGTLWVPSGTIVMGITDPTDQAAVLGLASTFPLPSTQRVDLLPGSVTSVSLNGAVLPYGSSTDGKEWSYDADPHTAATNITTPPAKQILISGDQVSLQQGATLDLSGGGDLQAYEWVPGTGGTRDLLSQTQTSYATSTSGTQLSTYSDGRAIYAIVPGYSAPVSAHDAALEKNAGAGPTVGQAVYLSGVAGLPDGVYTLLPARYATLPGAYRVVQQTSAADTVPGLTTTMADGTQVVAGYFTDALTGARAARNSTFIVQSTATWQQYSQYDFTSASQFFPALAAHAGQVAPPAPQDAGRLVLNAAKQLDLDTTLTASTGPGGRGAQVDIAGEAIQIVTAGSAPLDGFLHINADGLTRLGAASLLIGGIRNATEDGDAVDVSAHDVVVSNDAAHPLQAPELILVADGAGNGIVLDAGSTLIAHGDADTDPLPLILGASATTTSTGAIATPAISGDGTLLRLSTGAATAVIRHSVTGVDGPAGTAGGDLTIGAGVLLDGGASLSLDATGRTRMAEDAVLRATAIDVSANRIVFADGAVPADTSGLVIGAATLAQFAGADSVTLRSRGDIDFLGDVRVHIAKALSLSAGALTSDGGQVTIDAATLTLGNTLGAAGTFAAGTGSLALNAGELDFSAGTMTVTGFGAITATATQGIVAQGDGHYDFGGVGVTLATPVLLADTGSTLDLRTSGALALTAGSGTALTRSAQGGALLLTGGSVNLATNVLAPAGTVTVQASSGDLVVDGAAVISVAGIDKTFYDTQAHAPGGTLTLDALLGNVRMGQDITLDVAGAAGGGNAGQLTVRAEAGSATLQGHWRGGAASGYLGGIFVLDTAGTADLNSLADVLGSSGMNGSISVRSGAGDLALSADRTLTAHSVTLTADGTSGTGGHVNIDGTVDASGNFGGTINLYGQAGVDVEGRLLAYATAPGRMGGDIVLGTNGTTDGTLNTAYGYENVQAADSGRIVIGSAARLDVSGPAGDGTLNLRAPLLADGGVNVSIAPGATLTGANGITLEAYATWSTADQTRQSDPNKSFDGAVDPAGWYQTDAAGVPHLVPGHFVDINGDPVTDPDFGDADQVADYLARYVFVPDAPNAAHQTFYGYVNGDPAQGRGTLMNFVQNPGFTFEPAFAGIANIHVRPGIVLVNPDATVNHGDISVLTNWNLGAQDSDGSSNLAFRYRQTQAPVLELRAFNDLKIQASITDGFYQSANVLVELPQISDWQAASLAWDQLQLHIQNNAGPDGLQFFSGPIDVDGTADTLAVSEYYGQYVAYADYLTNFDDGPLGQNFFSPGDVIAYGLLGSGGTPPQPVPGAPTPPATITRLSEYPAYFSAYVSYLQGAATASDFINTFIVPDTLTPLAAPPSTALDHVAPPPAATDNSPSPLRTAGNPLPLLSATLAGGASTSYRLVAGANVKSADPLAVQAGAVASQLSLDGHTDYTDPATGTVVYAPTMIRTGTGSIDMVSAGDIRWLDTTAPAAVYTGGRPADGTIASQSATLLSFQSLGTPYELVVTGGVNPVDGGDISLHAGGDITGIQQVSNSDGSAGTPLAQYWWQWMQTGNTSGRSSITFSAFDQGVMSAGGNIDVNAGGDIRGLSVSLPTTWVIDTDAAGNKTVDTLGGGDLRVNAGGDILSGTYFVARGTGTITAGGSIGSDFSFTGTGVSGGAGRIVTTPVSTLLAMQDAQIQVQARGTVDIGGVYNPSWLDMAANLAGGLELDLPVHHFDGQSYSADSSLSVLSTGGDVDFGSLHSALALIIPTAPGVVLGATSFVLPATVSLASLNGDLDISEPGELYPSASGNLTLLAGGSIQFSARAEVIAGAIVRDWGLIDAPASFLPSPLNTDALTSRDGELGIVRTSGYLMTDDIAQGAQLVHQAQPLHGNDADPVRIYALDGDIVNGFGGGYAAVYLVPNKPARIEAGRDIVDLAFVGAQSHASDITRIAAGRDIYDTSLLLNSTLSFENRIAPIIAQGGPGTLQIEAGRDIGPLTSQADLVAIPQGLSLSTFQVNDQNLTGIDTIGNFRNPYLPYESASVQILYGVAPGVEQVAFIAKYVDPAAGVAGVPSLTPDLVTFMDNYVSGLDVDTGLLKDKRTVNLSVADAWAAFQALPADVQRVFVEQALFKILATVGGDYNEPSSPFFQQYARGYDALSTLFPASLGYTDNGSGLGGANGASQTIDTGNLDIRNTTIQTQQGGSIDILAPGGEALLGSSSAPPVITDANGRVVAGPNSMGVLTLRQGDINIFTDRSVLLAQSRIFTEQGGGVTIWSSNGDINAGKGAKTTSETQPSTYLCDINGWCRINLSGEVSGAGIATLQTIPGAPAGDAFLMAPRGTVDAGDAGIRVSGNLVVAAAHVANADNIQVQGKSTGVPVVAQVNVAALTSASAAATAAADAADGLSRQRQAAARQALPSIITVQVLGFGNEGMPGAAGAGTAPLGQPVSDASGAMLQTLGRGQLSEAQLARLSPEERRQLGL